MEQKRQEDGTIEAAALCVCVLAIVLLFIVYFTLFRASDRRGESSRLRSPDACRLAIAVGRAHSEAAFAERHFSTLEQFYLLSIPFIFYTLCTFIYSNSSE